MGLGPTVEDSCDSGVATAMPAGVGAEVGTAITAVVSVELGIDAGALTGSGSAVASGDPLHPASCRRIRIPSKIDATGPEARPALMNFPLLILLPIPVHHSVRALGAARNPKRSYERESPDR